MVLLHQTACLKDTIEPRHLELIAVVGIAVAVNAVAFFACYDHHMRRRGHNDIANLNLARRRIGNVLDTESILHIRFEARNIDKGRCAVFECRVGRKTTCYQTLRNVVTAVVVRVVVVIRVALVPVCIGIVQYSSLIEFFGTDRRILGFIQGIPCSLCCHIAFNPVSSIEAANLTSCGRSENGIFGHVIPSAAQFVLEGIGHAVELVNGLRSGNTISSQTIIFLESNDSLLSSVAVDSVSSAAIIVKRIECPLKILNLCASGTNTVYTAGNSSMGGDGKGRSIIRQNRRSGNS